MDNLGGDHSEYLVLYESRQSQVCLAWQLSPLNYRLYLQSPIKFLRLTLLTYAPDVMAKNGILSPTMLAIFPKHRSIKLFLVWKKKIERERTL